MGSWGPHTVVCIVFWAFGKNPEPMPKGVQNVCGPLLLSHLQQIQQSHIAQGVPFYSGFHGAHLDNNYKNAADKHIATLYVCLVRSVGSAVPTITATNAYK